TGIRAVSDPQLVGHRLRGWNFYNPRGGPGGQLLGPPMRGGPRGVDQFEPPLDPLRCPSVRMLVHSGMIRLDSESSNRNSRRLGRPNSWDIASRGNFLKFEGGVPWGGQLLG